MMMANFKQKMQKCFFKYQYSSVRSYVETFIPQELDADAKKKRAKNMSKHACHLINTLVFSTTYAADDLRLNASTAMDSFHTHQNHGQQY
jgi:hypothetical protein